MKQQLTKLAIGWLLMICSTFSNAQSHLSPGAQFFAYYNAHDVKNLDALLSDDFVMKLRFMDKTITKEELLGPYMNYYVQFNVGYNTIAVILEGNPEIISVLEYNDQFKLLQLNPPAWNFLIESEGGKVTSMLMDTARGADAYFKELLSKETAFRTWVEQKYGTDTVAALDNKVVLYYKLMSEYASNATDDVVVQSKEVIAEREVISDAEDVFRMPCTHFGNLSLKQRLARYPFNKAKSVLLISFTDSSILYPDYDRNKQRILALSNVENKKVLTTADIDKLSDLLFNIGYDTKNLFKTQVPECPELKNAIVFLDAKGKPFDYIGLYFGCNGPEYDISKIRFPVVCDEKYDMLSQFFLAHGIATGL